jgi:hypothetical protein
MLDGFDYLGREKKMVKYLLTSQSTERTVQVYGLISFTRIVQNRTMAAASDL